MFSMVNVVWYDYSDAYVSKFILETENGEVTTKATNKVIEYLAGNGELLKLDVLYPISIDNLIVYKDSDQPELQVAYDRFNQMYFG